MLGPGDQVNQNTSQFSAIKNVRKWNAVKINFKKMIDYRTFSKIHLDTRVVGIVKSISKK